MQHISLRKFLIALLVILMVLTLTLLYLYYIISRPVGAPAYQTKQMKHLFSIYGYGTKEDELLYRPTDVAFDGDGSIYIADTGRARILVFRSSGEFLRKIGKKGFGKGELMEPIGITTSKGGQIIVADKTLNKIVIYDQRGNFQSEFKVMVPLKPYVANGKIYVTTYGHIVVYNFDGKIINEWARKGREKGNVDSPMGITVNTKGDVFIADTLNLRLQAFTKGGKLLWVNGEPAKDIKAVERKFGLPCGIAMDEKELLYLVDAFDPSIRILNKNGKQLAVLGKEGSREGEFNLPSGIAYDENRVFAIADKFNDRVQIIKLIIE